VQSLLHIKYSLIYKLSHFAAMIAWLGILMHKSGVKIKEIDFDPSERTDDVEVTWR